MADTSILECSGSVLQQLESGGAFLTVKNGSRVNTMTIGWGAIGTIWGMRVFIALVRPMRHTHEMLDQNDDFTVSIPHPGTLRKELGYAGTASGRDQDKFAVLDLTAASTRSVDGCIVSECPLHLECRTVLKQDITDEHMSESLRRIQTYAGYSGNNFHTLYFGEIKEFYSTDSKNHNG